jgi:long-subunit fatty acid transport protein
VIQGGNRFSYNSHLFTRSPTLDWGNVDNGVPPYVEFSTAENEQNWQLLDPLLGIGFDLGLDDWGFALFAYAPPGISRQGFPVGDGQRYMMVSREAQIINYTANAAWKSGEKFGVGASLQWIAVPLLRYQLVIDANQFPGEANPVASELDMLATVEGSDPFTFNAILGAWYRPMPALEFGIAGQIVPTEIKTESTLSIDPLSPEIDDQVVLRREGEEANDVSLTLPLPLMARAGVRYRHLEGAMELFDVELDVVYETWSRVERFTVDSNGLVANLLAQRISVDVIDVEKQWQDTVSVHLGSDVAVLPRRLTLRGGVFYESAVADRRYANVDFPGGEQLGGALGASLFLGRLELAFGYEYRYQAEVTVTEGEARVFQETPGSQCKPPFTDPDNCHPQYLGRPAPPVNAGRYLADSHMASLDVLYRF